MYRLAIRSTLGNPLPLLRSVLFVAVILVSNGVANAHELWIDTQPTAQPGESHTIEVCWGHTGERADGKSLDGQSDKLLTTVVLPDGSDSELRIDLKEDCFTAATTPKAPGYYTFGSELQTGIIPRELHGIPANTRIVMYGKTLTHVPGSEEGLTNAVGQELEIIPLAPAGDMHRGGVAQARLLFKGKPLGGAGVDVTLATAGEAPLPQHRRIQSHQWTISATPDPYTGEVAFPLIAGGKHVFSIRYMDETPGTYDGPRNDYSDFSHLRKGDAYERTMYVSTLTIWVWGE